MPGYPPPNSTAFPYMLAQMRNQIRASATSQQLVISNLQGQPIMVTGLQPGSNPPRWGLGLLRKAFRGVAAFFGENETGTVGAWFYGPTGAVLVKLNETGLFYPGPGAGGFTRLSPPHDSVVTTELTTSSATWTTLGGPSVTVTVSAAGRALVCPSSIVGIDSGTTAGPHFKQGNVGVQVDGGVVQRLISVSQSVDKTGYITGVQVTGTNSYIWSGLASGAHTFKCVYRSTNAGQAVHFSYNSLVVISY